MSKEFRYKKDARKYANKLKKEGYTPRVHKLAKRLIKNLHENWDTGYIVHK